MIFLLDTNVLLRITRSADPLHQIVHNAVDKLEEDGYELRTTSQNYAEFWNVSTRPANQNGFGRTILETDDILSQLERLFPLLQDLPEMYPKWRQLVVDYEVSGVKVHDVRLVALMITHNVTHILTFNTSDFIRYASEGIVAIDPIVA